MHREQFPFQYSDRQTAPADLMARTEDKVARFPPLRAAAEENSSRVLGSSDDKKWFLCDGIRPRVRSRRLRSRLVLGATTVDGRPCREKKTRPLEMRKRCGVDTSEAARLTVELSMHTCGRMINRRVLWMPSTTCRVNAVEVGEGKREESVWPVLVESPLCLVPSVY